MPDALDAIPPNPKIAAMIANAKNPAAHFNINPPIS